MEREPVGGRALQVAPVGSHIIWCDSLIQASSQTSALQVATHVESHVSSLMWPYAHCIVRKWVWGHAESPRAILEQNIPLYTTMWQIHHNTFRVTSSHLSLDKQCPYWSNEVPNQHVCEREGVGNQLRWSSVWGLRLSVCGGSDDSLYVHSCVCACFMLTTS